MKSIIYLMLFFYLNVVKSQPSGGCPGSWFHGCNCSNSSVATNFCCGHDPELKTQDDNHRLLVNAQCGQNFCNNSNYTLENKTGVYQLQILIENPDVQHVIKVIKI
ncbi:MAG: hypothetical protein LCH32_11870 [Bacteroidetes bacterium]|nr:hypothetical protein [Bacteroidota bacterium]